MKNIHLIRLFIAVILSYGILQAYMHRLGSIGSEENIVLDSYITTEVFRTDGSTESYEANKFDVVDRGDMAVATLPLPKEQEIDNAGLCFLVSNCKVEVYYKDTLLYSYGGDLYEKGWMIGAVYPRLKIPQEAWGEALTIVCTGGAKDASPVLMDVTVMKEENLVRYSIAHRELRFMIYVTMFIISFMMFLYFILNGRYDSFSLQGIYLAIFMMLTSTWILCYTGMYQFFSEQTYLYVNMEYISLFLSPIPFLLYMIEHNRGKRYEQWMKIMLCIVSAFFVIAVVCNYCMIGVNFTVTVKYFHIILLLTGLLAIHICMKLRKEEQNEQAILLTGFSVVLGLFIVDIIIYNLNKYTAIQIGTRKYSLSESGIAIFSMTLVLHYVISILRYIISEKEKRRLEELAYIDSMTGLVNRTGCYEMMKTLNEKKNSIYKVIYFDVNSLKKANDIYGHEEGGRLLSFVSKSIQRCFGENAFCGRMGGDEFIVVVGKKEHKLTEKMLQRFEDQIAFANQQKQFPFPIGVSYGVEKHEASDERTAEEVIRAADAKMYIKKKMTKQ